MKHRQLWAFGLTLLLVGAIGTFGKRAPRLEGTSPVDDGQASQIVGGQYCSWYTVHNECGGAAKYNPTTGQVMTYCPLNSDTDYNPLYGVSGTRGPIYYCVECGVSCGSYYPLLVCGS